jgi:hypothetical protein
VSAAARHERKHRAAARYCAAHDLAGDVAAAIEHAGGGPAVVPGHAFGNWVARCSAPLLALFRKILSQVSRRCGPDLARADSGTAGNYDFKTR